MPGRCNVGTNLIPMSGPKGASMVDQAILYARAAQVREFEPGAQGHGRQNPSQFDMIGVLEAMRNGEAARRVAAVVALQEFLRAPEKLRRKFRTSLYEFSARARVTEGITFGDFPADANIRAYIDRFLITPGEMDTSYEQIFMIHDVATAEAQLIKSYFKILNVTSGVTFKKRLPGEPVELRQVRGSEVTVEYDMFGGGLSIDRVYWDDQDYMSISDVFFMMREDYYFERAKAFYSLITGLGNTINFNKGADLIAKINGACATILRAVQGKGYSASANSEFVVLYAPEKAGEVDGALRTNTDFAIQQAAGKQRLKFRIRPVMSVHVPVDGDGAGIYVILPKGKLKGGYRMDLTLFGRFDPVQYADDLAGFGRYAGIVGDTDQVKRIP